MSAPGRAAGGTELWLVRQPSTGTAADDFDRGVLDDTERERAGTCRRSAGGRLYALAHIALRRLLGHRLGLPPAEILFVREPCPGCGEPHGRPAVHPDQAGRAGGVPTHFSLSHGSGLVLLGLSSAPIGVDVEQLPGGETVQICAPALHPDEYAELAALGDTARRQAFGRLWTRKEAYLKGIGTGLSRGLSADYLGTERTRHPRGWAVRDLPCDPGHVAAVAWRGAAGSPVTARSLALEWLREQTPGAPYGALLLPLAPRRREPSHARHS
ncbi:4'-phosphopantetheinyl transferase superfamily protein [Streptomyces sp. NPDC006175]|uniref:4'-phosphopantetheinyl transferase family protein n=1 Tax=Streptomyces sp. NPDC006175 TaxID=3154471 RepID=UPI0033A8274D